MRFARIPTIGSDTQTSRFVYPRPSLFFIRGLHNAVACPAPGESSRPVGELPGLLTRPPALRSAEARATLFHRLVVEGQGTLKAASPPHPDDGPWGLRGDLVVTNALLWVVSVRHAGEPRPEVHLYLYDRYRRLADYYQRRGKRKKAAGLYEKAEEHYTRSGRPGPPFAAALAMPRPRSPFFTWAVGNREPRGPNDAA
jgi:hypothetical protein